MSPLWVAKYLKVVPAVFISIFEMVADPNTDSLRDNQLKNEIASIRSSIEESRYRSRYAVILIGDKSVVNGPELEERVINIRRAARLDEKCLFFLDAGVLDNELSTFASQVLSSMQSFGEEFYRDLTRHARRKRDKSSNISHSISRLGWIARYEYKLGVFAEFRAEFEIAERHYHNSLMALFDAQGPFESTSSWSPRWSETRLWSDTTFIRLIRAQLANNSPTSAERSWTRHRDRMRDLLNRKGKGIENYGYITWEARWARIMADLTRNNSFIFAEPFEDNQSSRHRATRAYAKPEKHLIQEQQQPSLSIPWQYLHHAGYWLRMSIACTKRRLQHALEMPEEDHVSPAESPASSVVRRSEVYDTYLALEPHSEWRAAQNTRGAQNLEIISNLSRATGDFQDHNQHRTADQLRLDLCQHLMQASQYKDAISVIRPLWKSTKWRTEKWRNLLQQLTLMLNQCSRETDDLELQIATLWELSNAVFKPISDLKYDLASLLQNGPSVNDDAHIIKLDNVSTLSCIAASFSFGRGPAYVGEKLPAQLFIKYDVHETCSPMNLQSLFVEFDDKIPGFQLLNQDEIEIPYGPDAQVFDISFEDPDQGTTPTRSAFANLGFRAGQEKMFNVPLIPEKSGLCTVIKIVSKIGIGTITIEHTTWVWAGQLSSSIGCELPGSSVSKFRQYLGKATIEINPRPPKLDMSFQGLRNIYYTDEPIQLGIVITNEEDEEAEVEISFSVQSDTQATPLLRWTEASAGQPPSTQVLGVPVGKLASGNTRNIGLVVEASQTSDDIIVEAHATYTLPSSQGRKIEKSTTADVTIIKPFEATYQTFADYNPNVWPDYFHLPEGEDLDLDLDLPTKSVVANDAQGIATTWQLCVKVTSFATDTLLIKNLRLDLSKMNQPAKVDIIPAIALDEGVELVSNGQHTTTYTLNIRKVSLDENRPVVTEPTLDINWQRLDMDEESSIHTNLQLPRSSFAGMEPRVLACQLSSGDEKSTSIEYVIENPSMHFLTFNVSTESSEDYAFSGPKQTTIQLTPLTRHSERYLFLPFARDAPIRPNVKITDVCFNKVLNVIPTGGLRSQTGELVAYTGKTLS